MPPIAPIWSVCSVAAACCGSVARCTTQPSPPTTAADFARNAPPILGLLTAIVLLAGLRGGAQGGPVALEAADVMHVMLSPVDRRRALLRPALQRVRGAIFVGATAGAIAGQLAGRRLPGTLLAWAGGGALFGASVAMLWAASALLAHTLLARSPRVPRWAATAIGMASSSGNRLRCTPSLSDSPRLLGPARRVRQPRLVGLAAASPRPGRNRASLLVAVVCGLLLLGRISLEALARRSALVAQLRFAVTMQDLRTVILLRRQLNQEHTRRRPWRRLRAEPARSQHIASVHPRGRSPRVARLAALSRNAPRAHRRAGRSVRRVASSRRSRHDPRRARERAGRRSSSGWR